MGYGAGTRERWKWGGQLGSAAGVGDIDDAGLVWGFIRGDREKQNQLGVWISFIGLRNYQGGKIKNSVFPMIDGRLPIGSVSGNIK